jgi:acetyl-CoA/propionyl-CoA carboxylase biotin carboxyl carrier protein
MCAVVAVIHATDGALVRAGDPVLTMECMKQFWPVSSPSDGRITILARLGAVVDEGAVLAEVRRE